MAANDNIYELYMQLAVRISMDDEHNLLGTGVLFLQGKNTEAFVLTAYHVVDPFLRACECADSNESGNGLICHVCMKDSSNPKRFTVSRAEAAKILKHEKAIYVNNERFPEGNKLEYDAAIIRVPYETWMDELPRFRIGEGEVEHSQIGWGYPQSQLDEAIPASRSPREGKISDTVNSANWFVKFEYDPKTVGGESSREKINKGFSGAGIFQKYPDKLVLSGVISGGVGNQNSGAEMKLAKSRLFLEIFEQYNIQLNDSSVFTPNRDTDDDQIIFEEKIIDFFKESANQDVLERNMELFDGFPEWYKAKFKGIYSVSTKYLSSTPPDKNLCGRDRELNELVQLADKRRHILINGIGGIGKTAVARALFHRIASKYEQIGWISFRTNLKDSMLLDIICEPFSQIEDPELRIQSICSYFRNGKKKTLLFIDDMSKNVFEDDLFHEMMGWNHISLIVTSRNEQLEDFLSFSLDCLSEKDSILLFQRYYNRYEEGDTEDATFIVNWAHYHTFTIELLAKAARREANLEIFIEKLHRNGYEATKLRIQTERNIEKKTILEHMRLLFDMRGYSPNSEEYRILWNLAIMPTIGIEKDVEEWIASDINAFDDLIEAGWIEFRNGCYYMHALVKDIILFDLVDGKAPDGIADAFVQSVVEQNYCCLSDTYKIKKDKLSILLSVLSYIDIDQLEQRAVYYKTIAWYYQFFACYSQAEHYLKKAFDIYELKYGKEDGHCINVMTSLADIYDCLGKKKESEQLLLSVLQITEEKYGPDDLKTAKIYNQLGNLYHSMNEYGKSERYLNRALVIRENQLGAESEITAHTYNDISFLFSSMGKYAEAEKYGLKALDIFVSVYGTMHTTTGVAYNSIAGFYYHIQNYSEAEKYFLKALDIAKSELEEHPNLSATYTNLGNVYYHSGRFELAEKCYYDALRINEKIFDPYSSEVNSILIRMIELYSFIGNKNKVDDFFERIVESFNHNGLSEIDRLSAIGNLAMEVKRYSEAEKYYLLLLKALSDSGGIDNRRLASCYASLAGIPTLDNSLKESYMLSAIEAIADDENPHSLFLRFQLYANLGYFYEQIKKYDAAERIMLQSIELLNSFARPVQQVHRIAYGSLAKLYIEMKKYKDAESYYLRAIEGLENDLDLLHIKTVTDLFIELADMYGKLRQYKNEEKVYKSLIDLLNLAKANSSLQYGEVCHKMATFFYEQKRYEEAITYCKVAKDVYVNCLGESSQRVKDIDENIQLLKLLISRSKKEIQPHGARTETGL